VGNKNNNNMLMEGEPMISMGSNNARKKSGIMTSNNFIKVLEYSRVCHFLNTQRFVEGKVLLIEKEAARMICNIQNFMENNLGRLSLKPRVITKLPVAIFRDRSTNGPMVLVLKEMLSFQEENQWDSFDLSLPGRKVEGLHLLQKLEQMLLKVSNHLNTSWL